MTNDIVIDTFKDYGVPEITCYPPRGITLQVIDEIREHLETSGHLLHKSEAQDKRDIMLKEILEGVKELVGRKRAKPVPQKPPTVTKQMLVDADRFIAYWNEHSPKECKNMRGGNKEIALLLKARKEEFLFDDITKALKLLSKSGYGFVRGDSEDGWVGHPSWFLAGSTKKRPNARITDILDGKPGYRGLSEKGLSQEKDQERNKYE